MLRLFLAFMSFALLIFIYFILYICLNETQLFLKIYFSKADPSIKFKKKKAT